MTSIGLAFGAVCHAAALEGIIVSGEEMEWLIWFQTVEGWDSFRWKSDEMVSDGGRRGLLEMVRGCDNFLMAGKQNEGEALYTKQSHHLGHLTERT